MIYLNGKEITVSKFPNGESLIKTDKISYSLNEINTITFKFEKDEDFIHLAFIKKHLDEINFNTILEMPYVPYSRMDRTEGKNVFTLKYICSFINDLNFMQVVIHEPHSDVSVALLDRCLVINKTLELLEIAKGDLNLMNDDYIFFPDQGAEKRYSKSIKGFNVLTGIKERDFSTGYIKKLDVVGDKPAKEFKVVIIDDLCSRGGTFMMSAKKLKELGAKEIYLIIAHCENTIFEGELLSSNLIDKIYTTDSILNKPHEKIIIEEGM